MSTQHSSIESITPVCAFAFQDGNATPARLNDKPPASGYLWLHLDLNESLAEQWLASQLPDIPARAIVNTQTRPRCDVMDEGVLLNLRGVNLNPAASPDDMVSLRLWVTENRIISVRLRKVFAIDAIRKKAETGQGPTSVGAFLVELIGNLTRRIESVVNEIEETTDEIEEALSEETISIEEITKARMTTIKLIRYMSPQREALDDLIEQSIPWLDESALALISEYGNRNRRILETLDATRERLTALRDFVEAERANVLNRNSYLLSVIAAIFLPLGFLTGLFGVNVAGMPGTELASAFWYLTLGSIVAGAALYIVFKLLKWL